MICVICIYLVNLCMVYIIMFCHHCIYYTIFFVYLFYILYYFILPVYSLHHICSCITCRVQWERNWIKICRLLILLKYKYPILFCKMAYLFTYLFLKNEITKYFFEIHFLIRFRSHWFRSHRFRFRIYLRLALRI